MTLVNFWQSTARSHVVNYLSDALSLDGLVEKIAPLAFASDDWFIEEVVAILVEHPAAHLGDAPVRVALRDVLRWEQLPGANEQGRVMAAPGGFRGTGSLSDAVAPS